jgi:hypothetical protein
MNDYFSLWSLIYAEFKSADKTLEIKWNCHVWLDEYKPFQGAEKTEVTSISCADFPDGETDSAVILRMLWEKGVVKVDVEQELKNQCPVIEQPIADDSQQEQT